MKVDRNIAYRYTLFTQCCSLYHTLHRWMSKLALREITLPCEVCSTCMHTHIHAYIHTYIVDAALQLINGNGEDTPKGSASPIQQSSQSKHVIVCYCILFYSIFCKIHPPMFPLTCAPVSTPVLASASGRPPETQQQGILCMVSLSMRHMCLAIMMSSHASIFKCCAAASPTLNPFHSPSPVRETVNLGANREARLAICMCTPS